MKKLFIALVDDWELRGNGLGSVYDLQYKPVKKLMDLYERLGVNATFNIEVMQQLAFNKYSSKVQKIDKETKIWIDSVLQMFERGFDIQLHIHPQWHNAEYIDGFWKLDKRWNIGTILQRKYQKW